MLSEAKHLWLYLAVRSKKWSEILRVAQNDKKGILTILNRLAARRPYHSAS
jgi:hypothetical protein